MSKHVNKKKRNPFVVLYKSGTIISLHLIEWNFINNFICMMRLLIASVIYNKTKSCKLFLYFIHFQSFPTSFNLLNGKGFVID